MRLDPDQRIIEQISSHQSHEYDPQVQFLREFRDEIVLKSMFKAFFEGLLDQYYKFSPTIAKKMEENPLFRSFMKYSIVYPFVIGAKGVASCVRKAEKMFDDTPSNRGRKSVTEALDRVS